MNDIVNALKTPFVTLPAEDMPPTRTVAIVWGAMGLLLARVLR